MAVFRAVMAGWTCLAAAAAEINPRGTPAGTNDYPVIPLRNLAGVAWEARPGFRDFSSMAIAGDAVVTGNTSGRGGTFAFDAATGKLLWRIPGQMKGEPAAAGDAVFSVNDVGGDTFRLSALARKSGKPLWSVAGVKLGQRNGPPLASGGSVWLLSDNGKAGRYDAATGKLLWEHAYSPGRGYCPTALSLAEGILYFGGGEEPGARSQGRFLWALDAATGKELWRFAARPETGSPGECVEAPAVAGGVVVTAAWNVLFALDAKTGALRWKQEVRRMVGGRNRRRTLSEPVIAGGAVYSYSQEGLLGWDLNTGNQVFEFPGNFPAEEHRNRMAAAGGILYFTANVTEPGAASSRYLNALDLKTRRILWSHRVNRPSGPGAEADWRTRFFLPAGGAVYYENAMILVKLH